MDLTAPGGVAVFLALIFMLPLLLIPVARILRRTGHSRWWCLIAWIPLVDIVGLWMLAYVKWPAVDKHST